jgi:hypothetical protein
MIVSLQLFDTKRQLRDLLLQTRDIYRHGDFPAYGRFANGVFFAHGILLLK